MKKYVVKFDYGYVKGFEGNCFTWTDKPVLLSGRDKARAVKNMNHYDFNYEVIEFEQKKGGELC